MHTEHKENLTKLKEDVKKFVEKYKEEFEHRYNNPNIKAYKWSYELRTDFKNFADNIFKKYNYNIIFYDIEREIANQTKLHITTFVRFIDTWPKKKENYIPSYLRKELPVKRFSNATLIKTKSVAASERSKKIENKIIQKIKNNMRKKIENGHEVFDEGTKLSSASYMENGFDINKLAEALGIVRNTIKKWHREIYAEDVLLDIEEEDFSYIRSGMTIEPDTRTKAYAADKVIKNETTAMNAAETIGMSETGLIHFIKNHKNIINILKDLPSGIVIRKYKTYELGKENADRMQQKILGDKKKQDMIAKKDRIEYIKNKKIV